MKPETTLHGIGVVDALCLHGVGTAVPIVGGEGPPSFGVAVHLDVYLEGGGNGGLNTPANQLPARRILAVEFDGILAARCTKMEKVAPGGQRKFRGVGTEPHFGVVVGGRTEGLPDPKPPFELVLTWQACGEPSLPCRRCVRLKLEAAVDHEAGVSPDPGGIGGEIAIRKVVLNLRKSHERQN